ncbi:unnamed protein product [Scytosiphon promiscuus]
MDGHVIARSTAYQTAFRVIAAVNACGEMDCRWPEGEDVANAAESFKKRSSNDVIRKCVGDMDGLFIRRVRPKATETSEPSSFFSGHKKGFGMNFQVRCGVCLRASYILFLSDRTMNCPGSQNDRTAYKFSGFEELLKALPPGHYILGDAANPPSDRVLVPFPGMSLSVSQDAFNFYQSQGRMSIEQTYGIMVSR